MVVLIGIFMVNCINLAAPDQREPLIASKDNYRNYYEIFVYSFCDSDGDGIGDINGITEKLDYISEMGFDGIWLSPIMPSETYHKYDVLDYKDIDEQYGTKADFQNLIKECQKRNIKVVLDMVMNHSSYHHPWFQEAVAYLETLTEDSLPSETECPYVNYYNFSKSKVDDTWSQVDGTSWYYESRFFYQMPDLNLKNPSVKKEFEQIAKYWIDLGVDGFRMDAAYHYENEDAQENSEILAWLYQYCCSIKPDFYMVSEVWADDDIIAQHYASQTPSMFDFPVSSEDGIIEKAVRGEIDAKECVNIIKEYDREYASYNSTYIDAPFITNHDQKRVASDLSEDQTAMKFAAGLLLTMSGNPFVYYGEEIGMVSDGEADENKRAPMKWTRNENAGETIGPPDMTLGIEENILSVEEQADTESSLLNYYKRALRMRRLNPEIARGEMEIVDDLSTEDIAVIKKITKKNAVVLIYNMSEEVQKIDLASTDLVNLVIADYLVIDEDQVCWEENKLVLPGKSICLMRSAI